MTSLNLLKWRSSSSSSVSPQRMTTMWGTTTVGDEEADDNEDGSHQERRWLLTVVALLARCMPPNNVIFLLEGKAGNEAATEALDKDDVVVTVTGQSVASGGRTLATLLLISLSLTHSLTHWHTPHALTNWFGQFSLSCYLLSSQLNNNTNPRMSNVTTDFVLLGVRRVRVWKGTRAARASRHDWLDNDELPHKLLLSLLGRPLFSSVVSCVCVCVCVYT